MEITINIPQNTYSVPTEIRQEVVQAICDAFLNGRRFFPNYHGNCGRHRYVARNDFGGGYGGTSFEEKPTGSFVSKIYRIHGCEMQMAFNILIDAGYHIFRLWESGGYEMSKKPHLEYGRGEEVYEFTDFID